MISSLFNNISASLFYSIKRTRHRQANMNDTLHDSSQICLNPLIKRVVLTKYLEYYMIMRAFRKDINIAPGLI